MAGGKGQDCIATQMTINNEGGRSALMLTVPSECLPIGITSTSIQPVFDTAMKSARSSKVALKRGDHQLEPARAHVIVCITLIGLRLNTRSSV